MAYYPPRFLFRRYEIVKRIRPNENFLEIGAGNLKLSRELLRFFKNGTLIDYNEKIITLFQQLPPTIQHRLNLIIDDFSSHDFRDTFNCIIACEVLEHVENDMEFVATIHQLLKERGQLLLSVPSRKKFWSVHDEIVGHLRRYEKNEITEILRRSNFKNIEIISYGFPFVNLLRWVSVAVARYNYSEKKKWSQQKQSKESGIVNTGGRMDLTGYFVNKYSCAPLCLISSLFNKMDLSNGYIITADK